jgi:DNA-binding CsgD family transcriptional regulator
MRKASQTPLTHRQQACINMLMQGHSMESMARVLGIGARTVRFHLDMCRQKLQAVTLPQLVAKYILAQNGQTGDPAE